jgi:hypothetical protein
VHDTRSGFFDVYQGTHQVPPLTYGSRVKAGRDSIASPVATNRRADWLALPLAAAAVPTTVAPGPAAAAAQAAPAAAARAAPAPTPPAATPAAPAAPAAAPRPRDQAFYEEQAQRLKGLKLLRDQGVLTEEEYQAKRREILSSL